MNALNNVYDVTFQTGLTSLRWHGGAFLDCERVSRYIRLKQWLENTNNLFDGGTALYLTRALTRLIKRDPLGSAALVEKVEDVRVARQKPGECSSHANRNASADGLHRVDQSNAGEHAQQQDMSSPRLHLSLT